MYDEQLIQDDEVQVKQNGTTLRRVVIGVAILALAVGGVAGFVVRASTEHLRGKPSHSMHSFSSDVDTVVDGFLLGLKDDATAGPPPTPKPDECAKWTSEIRCKAMGKHQIQQGTPEAEACKWNVDLGACQGNAEAPVNMSAWVDSMASSCPWPTKLKTSAKLETAIGLTYADIAETECSNVDREVQLPSILPSTSIRLVGSERPLYCPCAADSDCPYFTTCSERTSPSKHFAGINTFCTYSKKVKLRMVRLNCNRKTAKAEFPECHDIIAYYDLLKSRLEEAVAAEKVAQKEQIRNLDNQSRTCFPGPAEQLEYCADREQSIAYVYTAAIMAARNGGGPQFRKFKSESPCWDGMFGLNASEHPVWEAMATALGLRFWDIGMEDADAPGGAEAVAEEDRAMECAFNSRWNEEEKRIDVACKAATITTANAYRELEVLNDRLAMLEYEASSYGYLDQ